MSRPALDIITSPQAEKMRDMVTYGFYDQSRVALWMMEVIGREFDDLGELIRTLRNEIFPQTCTWSIAIWEFVYGYEPDESKPLQWRRDRILAHRWSHPPVNPARIEAALSAISGTPVHITEHVAAYTFRVDFDESEIWQLGQPANIRGALIHLRRIKPSHLSFQVRTIVDVDYDVTDYHAGAVMESITVYFLETHPIATDTTDYHAGAGYDVIAEKQHESDKPIVTAITDYHATAAFERILEDFVQPGDPIATDTTDNHGGAEYAQQHDYFMEETPISTEATHHGRGATYEQVKEAFTEWAT